MTRQEQITDILTMKDEIRQRFGSYPKCTEADFMSVGDKIVKSVHALTTSDYLRMHAEDGHFLRQFGASKKLRRKRR